MENLIIRKHLKVNSSLEKHAHPLQLEIKRIEIVVLPKHSQN